MKVCAACGKNEVTGKSNAAKYCDECKSADPHRHRTGESKAPRVCDSCKTASVQGRYKYCDECRAKDKHRNISRKSKYIFVQIDGEGKQDAYGMMRVGNLNFGREDGTAGTSGITDAKSALMWAINNVSGEWQGKKQVAGGFFFGWDTAVIMKEFDPTAMMLLHKARHRTGDDDLTPLCSKKEPEHRGKPCPGRKRNHRCRYDAELIASVMTEGGESDLVAWDPVSMLAVSATPKRRFYAEYRPHGDDHVDYGDHKILDIHDNGTAFGGSLEQVISDWAPEITDEQRSIIEWGKKARSNHATFWDDPQKVAEYSMAECIAAARTVRKLITTVHDASGIRITPSGLYGSGSIASAAFKHNGIPKRTEQVTGEYADLAKLCYFGGIIDTPVVGIVHNVQVEDIASAYPSHAVETPCMRVDTVWRNATKDEIELGRGMFKNFDEKVAKLKGDELLTIGGVSIGKNMKVPVGKAAHGVWKESAKPDHTLKNTKMGRDAVVGYVLVNWNVCDIGPDGKVPSYTATPPFCIRTADGYVRMPSTGHEVWVTLPEYRAAVARYGPRISALKLVIWVQKCKCGKPMEFQRRMFEKRHEIKAAMKKVAAENPEWAELDVKQKALKLVINTCYGKLCQTRPTEGSYTNLHLGAYITGATRAQLRSRVWEKEDQGCTVVYCHTDSVKFIGGQAEDQGSYLGAWEAEEPINSLLIIQPGLAAPGADSSDSQGASRGVDKSKFYGTARKWASEIDLTRHPLEWPVLVIPGKRMISRRNAVNTRHDVSLSGNFVDYPMDLRPSPFKRDLHSAVNMGKKWGEPDAWLVPPVKYAESYATIEDIKKYQSKFDKLIAEDYFDSENESFLGDPADDLADFTEMM